MSGWLTAQLVEQIHKAYLKRIPVDEHISNLSNTTLSGLIEYGCLKRSIPDLPDLPQAILMSSLGQQLSRIRSEIGLPTRSPHASPTVDHSGREIEFVTVKDTQEFLSEPIAMMFMRITQAMKKAGFTARTANEFQGACYEMLANAIEHSDSPVPSLFGYHVREGIGTFVVADVGRGIYDSLREHPDHRDVVDHCDAITRALRDGVSRHQEARGNGFRPIFKALAESWGILRFRSKKGCRTLNGTGLNADQGTNHYPPELPGFQVSVSCRSTDSVLAFPVV